MEKEEKKKVIEKGEELVDKELENVSGGIGENFFDKSWRCPQCSEHNSMYDLKCTNCGAARPK